jgi:type IV pilus assembly protein PilC
MSVRSQQLGHSPRTAGVALLTLVRSALGAPIPDAALALFFDGMAVLLRSGVSIGEVLRQGGVSGYDPELRALCAEVAPKVNNGASLCACLRPYASRFPRIVLPFLEVGEASGGLEDTARRMADTFKQTASAERAFKMSVYDPRLVLLALGLIVFIKGVLGAVSSTAKSLPLPDVMLAVGMNAIEAVAGVVAVFFVGRTVSRHLYRWEPSRLFVDSVKLAVPGFGGVSRRLSAARWARSFATLWGAGVAISNALEISSASALNAHYERELRAAARLTHQGKSLSQCLSQTHLLPSNLLAVIHTSETTGRLDYGLVRLAADMERDALSRAIQEMNRLAIAGYVLLMFAAYATSK